MYKNVHCLLPYFEFLNMNGLECYMRLLQKTFIHPRVNEQNFLSHLIENLVNSPLTVNLLLFSSFIILTLIDFVVIHLFPVSFPFFVSAREKLTSEQMPVFTVHGRVKMLLLNIMSNSKHCLIPLSHTDLHCVR